MILHVPTRPVPQKAAVIQNQARYQRRCISTPHAEEERGPAGLEKKKKTALVCLPYFHVRGLAPKPNNERTKALVNEEVNNSGVRCNRTPRGNQ